jgi:hypothetical protein
MSLHQNHFKFKHFSHQNQFQTLTSPQQFTNQPKIKNYLNKLSKTHQSNQRTKSSKGYEVMKLNLITPAEKKT